MIQPCTLPQIHGVHRMHGIYLHMSQQEACRCAEVPYIPRHGAAARVRDGSLLPEEL